MAFTGTGCCLLDYILGSNATVLPEAEEPMYGKPNSPLDSVRHELTIRSELAGAHFAADNANVFEILKQAIFEHKRVYLQIFAFVQSKNGHDAWQAFKTHYLGTAALEMIVAC